MTELYSKWINHQKSKCRKQYFKNTENLKDLESTETMISYTRPKHTT